MKTFSPSEAAFEGFRVIRDKPGAVLVWALAYVVFAILMTALMVSLFGPQLAAMSQMSQDESKDPQKALALVGSMAGVIVLALPLGLLIQSIFYAAIFRSILRPAEGGFAYLRLGGDELRLIGLWIIQFFVFIGIYIGAWIAALILIFLAGFIGKAAHVEWVAGLVAIVAVIGVICAFIWVAVRLSLASPMTFAGRKISVFGSWRVTKGRFWSLLGCYILTFIFGILIAILGWIIALCVSAVISGDWTIVDTITTNPRLAMMRSGVFSLAHLLTLATIAQIVVSSLMQAVSRTIFLAPFAAAYRDLTVDSSADGTWTEPVSPPPAGLVL